MSIAVIIGWFLKSKLGNIVGVLLIAGLAFGAYKARIAWAEHHGYVRALEQGKKATEAESKRRLGWLIEASERGKTRDQDIADQEKTIADLRRRIDSGSAAHDRERCLGADSLRRLDAIRSEAGGRARQPAR